MRYGVTKLNAQLAIEFTHVKSRVFWRSLGVDISAETAQLVAPIFGA
jgi:hypothetical protein